MARGLCALSLVALGACTSDADRSERDVGRSRSAYADVESVELIADAPWRVQDSDTQIPFSVIITDAYKDATVLNSVKVTYFTPSGAERVLFYRDFGGIDLGSYAWSNQLFAVQIDRALAGILADGTALTPRNIQGSAVAGWTLMFRVDVDAAIGFDIVRPHLNSTFLRVHVGESRLPHGTGLFTQWIAGDTHVHSTYTHNLAEYGPPHRSIAAAAKAMGLDWVLTTDHSCDMDAPDTYGDRPDSYTICENGSPIGDCKWFDRRGYSSGWAMAQADAADAQSQLGSAVLMHAGEEVNVNSADGKTIHLLAYNAGYVYSPYSGAPFDAVSVTLPTVLGGLPSGALVFASHPTQPLESAVNGGAWTTSDIQASMTSRAFAGFELWNLRKTRSAPINAPWNGGLIPSAWTACSTTDPSCYPHYLDNAALPLWDDWLAYSLSVGGPHLNVIGGSDAHGDFNYETSTSNLVQYSEAIDSAFGKVRTVALAETRTIAGVLDALKRGRAIVTDGPMMTFGVDLTGDGTLQQLADAHVGSSLTLPAGKPLRFEVQWQTTPEFGDLHRLIIYRGTPSSGQFPASYEVLGDLSALGTCASKSREADSCRIVLSAGTPLAPPAAGQTYYYRAMALAGASETYRAITNPIWVQGVACTSDASCGGGSRCSGGTCVALAPAGSACSAATECASGHCVDSVCCATACADQCAACNVAGSPGTCVAVAGAPRGARPACSGDGTVCGGTCNGTDRASCSYPGTSVVCAAGSCTGGVATKPSTCDGSASCRARGTAPCAPYTCAATACRTSCTSSAHCTSGFACSAGRCVASVPDAGVPDGGAADGGPIDDAGRDDAASPEPDGESSEAARGSCACASPGGTAGRPALPALVALTIVALITARRSRHPE